jgi:arylformamidase
MVHALHHGAAWLARAAGGDVMDDAGIDYEAQYNAREALPDHPQILARWARDSAVLRQQLPCSIDLAWGDDPDERLDWFPRATGSPGPVLFFIHGGYWRTLDKDHFAFLVPPLQRLGLDVVLANYGLCPRVSIEEIVAQLRRGLAWVHAQAPGYGADPSRLYLAGHSAGGHLVAMLMATDWAGMGRGEVGQAIRGGLAISGIYDLAPLLGTSINVEARLDETSARALSPALLQPNVEAPLALAVGGDESAEFGRQAGLLSGAWPNALPPEAVPGTNHFTVLDELALPGGVPWRQLEALLAR